MSLSRAAVHRPVFTTMVTLIVLILGGVALSRIPIDLMPDITYPTLSITAEYENASPEEMEEMVTRIIEEALTAVPGVEEVSSTSMEGISRIRVKFSWGTDLDAASNDVRDRLDRVIRNLPEEVERPVLRKFDLASFPILILGVASDLDPIQLRRLIDDQVKYRIERVPGVASLDIRGGLDREIHVNMSPDKIKALGIPLDQILARITAGNVNLPAGTIERGNLEVTIRTPGEYRSLDELRDTVVALREGVPIRLREIAEVEDSWERVRRIVRIDGRPGVRLAVNKQSGSNTVAVAKATLKEVERINRDIPQINLTPIIDTSDYIQRSITNVGSSALNGGLLCVLVLLFFLRNLRSTFIIATAIPISIVATFVLIYFGGFTLNIMTLGGLALGVGMLVDNAIVVIDNITRIRDEGEEAEEAAVKGSAEVVAPVIASTLTTVVVFLPLIFVRGMAGIMFKQLALVVGFALLASLTVAITLVPMLAAKLIKPSHLGMSSTDSWWHKFFVFSARAFSKLEANYKRMLHWALSHRKTVITAAVLLLAGSALLIPFIGVEFMPTTDESEVRITAEAQVGTRLAVLDEKFKQVEEIVRREVPELKNMVSTIGGAGWGSDAPHTAQLRVALVPVSQRRRSSEAIAAALRRKISGIPGLITRTRAGQGLFIMRMGMGDTEQVQVEIRGHDLETADALAAQVKQIVEEVEGVTDARISREVGAPEELIHVDRQKAADMKLTVSQVASMLQTVLSGTRAGYYREAGKQYPIRVQLKEAEKRELSDILDLTLTNADGEPVVLRNVVRVEPRTGPVRIERKDQERIVTVSGNISGRDMGSIIADIQKRLRSLPLPRDFTIVFAGDYEEQQKSFRELMLGFVLSLILVYMVMACQYESLRDPFVVMFSVPLAAIGVILILLLTNTTFNVQSFIGCIMLGGIVVNNAIVLVDYINLLRRRDRMALREAIEEAGRRRLRPILMTTLTTCAGLLPLALGLGEGAEAQAPLARVVIGGLTSSAVITLLVVPVVYSLFEHAEALAPVGISRQKEETRVPVPA